jgi:hypothetical protein
MADGDIAPERTPAPKPTAPDPEMTRLRAEAQEAAALRGQLNQVAEMVQSGRLILKQPEAPKAVEPEDDSALIDRRELKRAVDEIKTTAANVIVETATHSARQMRVLAKDSMRGRLKNFDKYESEIDALLEKIPDPRVAASPETIAQVHKIVRANHIEDEMADTLAEKKAEWETDLRSKGWTPDEIEEEVDDRAEALREDAVEAVGAGRGEREGSRQARPVARSAGVAPAGNASGARLAASRQRAAVPPLSRDERVMADQFGISSAEEYRRYADPNYRHDSLGFHGKKRI